MAASNTPVTRRRALAMGAGLTAAGVLSTTFPVAADAASDATQAAGVREQHGHLPAARMQQILRAYGTVSKGVLSIDIDRDDIGDVEGPLGVTLTPAFEINGTLTFEPLGDDWAFFNGDLALKPHECNPFIDAILVNGLTFQAFHQHYIEAHPNVWFIHWRGQGHPLELGRAVKNVLDVVPAEAAGAPDDAAQAGSAGVHPPWQRASRLRGRRHGHGRPHRPHRYR